MKYANIIWNDVTAGNGVNVSFYTQGCPHRCEGCHNPETWDFNSGKEFTEEVLKNIITGLTANNIKRNFSILGGEPLCPENLPLVKILVKEIRANYPDIKIYLWTGYVLKNLLDNYFNEDMQYIMSNINYLIDGPYDQKQRDITLKMRGSRNQNIYEIGVNKDGRIEFRNII